MSEYTTKIIRNGEWGEYQVKLYSNGEFVENSTYFTSDKDDAHETASIMVRDAESREMAKQDRISPLKTYKFEIAVEIEAESEIQARAALRCADIEPDEIISCTHHTPLKSKSRNSMTMQEELEIYGGSCIYRGKCDSGPWRYQRFLRSEWNEIRDMLIGKGLAGDMMMSASTAEVWQINESMYVWMKCRARG